MVLSKPEERPLQKEGGYCIQQTTTIFFFLVHLLWVDTELGSQVSGEGLEQGNWSVMKQSSIQTQYLTWTWSIKIVYFKIIIDVIVQKRNNSLLWVKDIDTEGN